MPLCRATGSPGPRVSFAKSCAAAASPFVRIEPRIQPVPGDEGSVDVLFEVEEGQRVTVAEVGFTGNWYFTDEELRGAMNTRPEAFFWFRDGNYDDIDFQLDLQETAARPLRAGRVSGFRGGE